MKRMALRTLIGLASVALSLSLLPAHATQTSLSCEGDCLCYYVIAKREPPPPSQADTGFAIHLEKKCVQIPRP